MALARQILTALAAPMCAVVLAGCAGPTRSTAHAASTAATAPTPRPRDRELLELGQLVTLSGRCAFNGPFALTLATPRIATVGVRARIRAGPWRASYLNPGRPLALSLPAHRPRGHFQPPALTPVLSLQLRQRREPHIISAAVRLRVALDPANGAHPDCTLVDARVTANTHFNGR